MSQENDRSKLNELLGELVVDDEIKAALTDSILSAGFSRTAAPALARAEEFLSTVHGLSEMNVVRGLRKVIAGEESTFPHEVRLSVYGAPCGHTPPAHYPAGYGTCNPCRYPDTYAEPETEEEDNERWR